MMHEAGRALPRPAPDESKISRTGLKRSGVRSVPLIGVQQMQRLLRYREARGHLARVDRDLVRPIAIRPPELPLA
jgi:hypothetical protein